MRLMHPAALTSFTCPLEEVRNGGDKVVGRKGEERGTGGMEMIKEEELCNVT